MQKQKRIYSGRKKVSHYKISKNMIHRVRVSTVKNFPVRPFVDPSTSNKSFFWYLALKNWIYFKIFIQVIEYMNWFRKFTRKIFRKQTDDHEIWPPIDQFLAILIVGDFYIFSCIQPEICLAVEL